MTKYNRSDVIERMAEHRRNTPGFMWENVDLHQREKFFSQLENVFMMKGFSDRLATDRIMISRDLKRLSSLIDRTEDFYSWDGKNFIFIKTVVHPE